MNVTQPVQVDEAGAEARQTKNDFKITIVKFIRFINQTFSDPCNWPLRDEERIRFCREVSYQALEIEKSESFILWQLQIALKGVESSQGKHKRSKEKKKNDN